MYNIKTPNILFRDINRFIESDKNPDFIIQAFYILGNHRIQTWSLIPRDPSIFSAFDFTAIDAKSIMGLKIKTLVIIGNN